MKKLAVVVDALNDFMQSEGKLYIDGANELIQPIQQYLDNLDEEEYIGILYVQDCHNKEDYELSDEGKLYPIHCVYGTPGAELAINPPNKLKEWFMVKETTDMWYKGPQSPNCLNDYVDFHDKGIFSHDIKLDDFVAYLQKNVHLVEIVGVAADVCVKAAFKGFMNRGFGVEVPHHLTLGIQKQILEVG